MSMVAEHPTTDPQRWARVQPGEPVKRGTVRSKMFRHTYCSARLQRVYGHLGAVRHRAEVVEYRLEQHRERLAARLAALTCAG